MKILTARQMNKVDRQTTRRSGLPSLLLMENAGLGLYWALCHALGDLERHRVAIFCGPGNNGGDGLVLARQLLQRSIACDVFLLGRASAVTGDAGLNLRAYRRMGYPFQEVTSAAAWGRLRRRLPDYTILVDALLGTGLSRPLGGLLEKVVSDINATPAFTLAVDIPSGMFADSLRGGVPTVRADLTVTFTAPKIAHILNEDQEAIGRLEVVPIGTPAALLESCGSHLNLLNQAGVRRALPPRPIRSHKGSCGHVAVIAGSRGKSGAALLCARAALRSGSGLVTLFCPDIIQNIAASSWPELMTEGLASTDAGGLALSGLSRLLAALESRHSAALGPGLGGEEETASLARTLVRESPVPLVVDADALNAFQGRLRELHNQQHQPLILTPHPGEFSRLSGWERSRILSEAPALARRFARRHGLWLVLKGFRTLVAEPGGEVFVCPRGNPGMATAGMGDVLGGVLSALLGRLAARGEITRDSVTRVVSLAVWLHASAGDLAAASAGQESLTATDLLAQLPQAFQDLSSAGVRQPG